MNCGEDDSPPYIASYHNGPYSYSIASSASSSSASVFSNSDDASSQSSSDSESYDCPTNHIAPSFTPANGTCEQSTSTATCWPKQKLTVEVPTEQRQHPRRSSAAGCPPALVRQCDRKVSFVDSLVGKNYKNPLISPPAQ
jgi:PHO85 cyclin-5